MRVLRAAAAGFAALLAGCGTSSSGAGTGPAPRHAGSCQAVQRTPGLAWAGPGALTGIQFVSPQRGWVVGRGQILATFDGGRHWTVQVKRNLQLGSVDFVDDQHGWAVGASDLLATADAGRHWAALPEPCPVIRQVHFVSPEVGFAIAGGIGEGGPSSPLAPLLSGVLLATGDGGRTWHKLAAPADAQSVCFSTARRGWLGADGILYRTTDGGQTWQPTSARVRSRDPRYPALMTVQCAGSDSAWALSIGPGAGMSQEPHVGFHAGPGGTAAIFAEQYFRNPGSAPSASSPGSYAGPFSAISPAVAAFIDWCPACEPQVSVPWDLADQGGVSLVREGDIAGITFATAAAFVTARLGWVVGERTTFGSTGPEHSSWRIVSTTDGGRTWRVVWTSR